MLYLPLVTLFLATVNSQVLEPAACLSSEKQCGPPGFCIPLTYTCCGAGPGGCPPTEYCDNFGGCCLLGETCIGPGGIDISTNINELTSTINVGATYTQPAISVSAVSAVSAASTVSAVSAVSVSSAVAVTPSSAAVTSIVIVPSSASGVPSSAGNGTLVPTSATPSPPASFTGAAARSLVPLGEKAMLGLGLMAVLAI